MKSEDKKKLGKFYTITNPFDLNIFKSWFNSVPNIEELTIVEPFAGSNNIPKLMNVSNDWVCYDILPTTNLMPQYKIVKRDTIKNFPKGFSIGITNPPYLAKNSATRSKITYYGEPYDDLYKKCLEQMLLNLDYIAAIIPDSFITAGIFQERLTCCISLTCKMFDDTDCPVCLALFNRENTEDFYVYRMDTPIGKYNRELIWYKPVGGNINNWWKMNDPKGDIGIVCIDNTKQESIRFVKGDFINSDDIKTSSRALTRVSTSLKIKNMDLFLEKCNDYLNWYRQNTQDVFLTSFKGLREDGKYRRRLDFDTAQSIMSTVILKYKSNIL